MNKYSLEDLNSWVFERSIRKYQFLIVQNINFYLYEEEKLYKFLFSKANNDTNHLFFTIENKFYKIVSDSCSRGYILEKLFLEEINEPNNFNDNLVIFTGNGNFAHFIWNQFDALQNLEENYLNKKNKKLFLYQEIDTIFKVKDFLNNFIEINIEIAKNSKSIYLGSSFFSKKSRNKIKSFLKVPNTKLTKIYLGIRGERESRTFLNEIEFYSKLIEQIEIKCSNVKFIIDGFSFQNNNIDDLESINRSKNILKSINKIIDNSKPKFFDIISGQHINDFWKNISDVDFYITHEGTMQHKVAWLFPEKVGIIISGNPNSDSIVKWHLNQYEDSTKLYRLNKEFFKRIHNNSTEDRNKNFEIVEVTNAINETIDIINNELKCSNSSQREIIQYWENTPPLEIQKFINSWKEANPTFNHILFNKETASKFIKENFNENIYKAFLDIKFPAMASDVFRIAYILKRGGLYIDCASVAHNSITEVIDCDTPLVLFKKNHGDRIPNGFFYANKPYNKIIYKIWSHIEKNLLTRKDGNIWSLTGPGVIKKVFDDDPKFIQETTFIKQNEIKYVFDLVQKLEHKKKIFHWSTRQEIEPLYKDNFNYEPNIDSKLIKLLKSKKIIIHIGQHKTDSTAIQRYLVKEDDSKNYLYPKVGRTAAGHHKVIQLSTIDKQKIQSIFDDLYDEISKSSLDTIILSSEFFSSTNELSFKKINMSRLWKMLNKLISPFGEKTIFYYIREQAEAIELRLNQSIKSAICNDKIDINLIMKNPTLNYSLLYTVLQEYFPDSKIEYRQFSKNTLYKNDICSDFINFFSLYPIKEKIEKSNTSINSLEKVSIFFKVNKTEYSIKEKMILKQIFSKNLKIKNNDNKEFTILTKQDVSKIREHYDKLNSETSINFQYNFQSTINKTLEERLIKDEKIIHLAKEYIPKLSNKKIHTLDELFVLLLE